MSEKIRVVKVVQMPFSRSEATNWEDFHKRHRAEVQQWDSHDGIALLSGARDQVVFIKGVREEEGQKFITSRRVRILNGTFSGHMLPYYCKDAGFELVNEKLLKTRLEEERMRALRHRKEREQQRHKEEEALIHLQAKLEDEQILPKKYTPRRALEPAHANAARAESGRRR